ncbi:MAG TPA: hypothetical protein VIF62_22380 [Labilithrix sp.]
MIPRNGTSALAACFVAACGTLVGVTAPDFDGGVPDGGAGDDDAPAAVDAGEPGCDARFCSDFDPPFDKSPFEWAGAGGGALLSATADLSFSPPNALAVVTSGSDPTKFVVEPVAGWALPLRIELSVRVESTSGDGASLQIMHVKCGGSADTVTVKIGPAGSWFMVVTSTNPPSLTALPLHTWQPVTVELRADATTLTTSTGMIMETPCVSPQEVDLGSTAFSSTGDKGVYDVRIDRVRFR